MHTVFLKLPKVMRSNWSSKGRYSDNVLVTTRLAEISREDWRNRFSEELTTRARKRTTMESQDLEPTTARICITCQDLLSNLTITVDAIRDKTPTLNSQNQLGPRDIPLMYPLMCLWEWRLVMPRENNLNHQASLPLILHSIISKVNSKKQRPSQNSTWVSKWVEEEIKTSINQDQENMKQM